MDFCAIFEFDNFCNICKSHLTQIDNLCDNCKIAMPEEIENWKQIKQILDQHDKPTLEQARQLIGKQEEFLS